MTCRQTLTSWQPAPSRQTVLLQPLQRRRTVGGGQQGEDIREGDLHGAVWLVDRVDRLGVKLAAPNHPVNGGPGHVQDNGGFRDVDELSLSHDTIIAHPDLVGILGLPGTLALDRLVCYTCDTWHTWHKGQGWRGQSRLANS